MIYPFVVCQHIKIATIFNQSIIINTQYIRKKIPLVFPHKIHNYVTTKEIWSNYITNEKISTCNQKFFKNNVFPNFTALSVIHMHFFHKKIAIIQLIN